MNLPIQSMPVNRQTISLQNVSNEVNPSACVTGSINGNKVCVKLPVIGSRCLPLPIRVPAGAKVSACTCSTWGVPTGAKIKVIVAGKSIWSTSIGFGC